jgi:hypothetical protein
VKRPTSYQVELLPQHKPTGFTRHSVADSEAELKAFLAGEKLPDVTLSFRRLEIESAGETTGFYLLYIDAKGDPVTDTWHETVEDAMDQAELEFGVTRDEWQVR